MIRIDEAISTYIKMRDAITLKDREAKDFKAKLKDQMEKLELFIKAKLKELGTDSFKKKGVGTAFLAMKDSVSISDKEGFKSFLAKTMLLTLQKEQYLIPNGEWQPDGLADIHKDIEKILNSGAFDLLTVTANKNNCKTYMSEHNGLMPDGVDYRKEDVVQFRKG